MNIDEMQGIVFQIFNNFGVKTNLVRVRTTRKTIARSIGTRTDINIPILSFETPIVLGFIEIDEKSLQKNNFTDSEIKFILAHEAAHIFKSHSISTLFWNVLEKAAKGEQNENYEAVELIKILLALISKSNLPPNAVTLRDQEYEADELATKEIGDLNVAISCLKRLVGNDLNQPSHTWELFDNEVPAMTMGQRIEELKRRFRN